MAVLVPSPRARLARVALETALASEGVAAGSAGDSSWWATTDEGELLSGVLAVARRDGRYDVELHLVARWPVPPLHELGERIRERVAGVAAEKGLGESLGSVRISFGDLLEPGEHEVAER